MARRWIGYCVAHTLWIAMLVLWLPAVAYAQTEDPYQLQNQEAELHKAGKDSEALNVAERQVQLQEQHKEAKGALSSALARVAWYALFARQPEKALAASERAVKLAPHNLVIETNHAHALLFLGRTDEARAIYLGHKGEHVADQGKWETAIAKDFQEFRTRGLDHPEMTTIKKALANAPDSALAKSTAELHILRDQIGNLRDKGKYTEAIPLAEKLLAVSGRILGKEHPDTLKSATTLALQYYKQGRYAEAEQFYKRALEASERVLGREDPDTLTVVNNLAFLYSEQGRYAEAETLYRRALETQERVLGKEHPSTLISVNNLAGLYENQGRYAEAEPLYRRAFEARERLLGKEHPDTLISANNLAFLYGEQGRYAEAEPLYRRTLEARERVLGKEHPRTLTNVNNLAGLYDNQGRYAEA
ncbi:MAG: tetratricopeptide repeat protein, partial [Alphaproteobacteria bacterium]